MPIALHNSHRGPQNGAWHRATGQICGGAYTAQGMDWVGRQLDLRELSVRPRAV